MATCGLQLGFHAPVGRLLLNMTPEKDGQRRPPLLPVPMREKAAAGRSEERLEKGKRKIVCNTSARFPGSVFINWQNSRWPVVI